MDALGIVSLVGMGASGAALVAMRLRDRSPAARAFAVTALAPWNALTFAIRRRMAARRSPFTLANEPKGGLFAHLDGASAARAWSLEQELRVRYELAPFAACSTCDDYREGLYLLESLERLGVAPARVVAADGAAPIRVVDVGSKDFRYAFALARWAERLGAEAGRAPRPVSLVGVEIDGAGLYRSGHTRADRADAYVRQAGTGVRFVVEDFLAFASAPVHAVTAFFPFVLPYQLAAWGLPLAHFAPERFVARYRELLEPGGLLVVANHTAEEASRMRELLAEGFRHVRSVSMRTELVTYAEETEERTLHLFVREAPSDAR
jgi:SAM-dependent methyltransferase